MTKNSNNDSVPQGDFSTLGTLKLGDVTVADIFKHHFADTTDESYVDYVERMNAESKSVRYDQGQWEKMKRGEK